MIDALFTSFWVSYDKKYHPELYTEDNSNDLQENKSIEMTDINKDDKIAKNKKGYTSIANNEV